MHGSCRIVFRIFPKIYPFVELVGPDNVPKSVSRKLLPF